MKTKKISQKLLIAIISTVLNLNFTATAYSIMRIKTPCSFYEENTEVSFSEVLGTWNNGDYRTTFSFPLVAYIKNQILIIENSNSSLDLTITIKDFQGNELFSSFVEGNMTSSIKIPIYTLEEGNYILEINNSLGGYALGHFTI